MNVGYEAFNLAALGGGEINRISVAEEANFLENKQNETDADLVTLTQLEESLPNFGEHPADDAFLNYTFKPALMHHMVDKDLKFKQIF